MSNFKTLMTAALITVTCGSATANDQKPKEAQMPTTPSHGFAPPTSPMPISGFIVNLPPTVFKSKKNKDVQLEPQLLFIDEENAKKAFEKRDEVQKLVADAIQKTRTDLKTPAGKFLIKGEIMAKLNEHGYNVEGLLWNAIRY